MALKFDYFAISKYRALPLKEIDSHDNPGPLRTFL